MSQCHFNLFSYSSLCWKCYILRQTWGEPPWTPARRLWSAAWRCLLAFCSVCIFCSWQLEIVTLLLPHQYLKFNRFLVRAGQNQQMTCAPSKDSDQRGPITWASPVWSESSLSTWRRFGSLAIHIVHSQDSGQTGCISFCRFRHNPPHLFYYPRHSSKPTKSHYAPREDSDQAVHLCKLIETHHEKNCFSQQRHGSACASAQPRISLHIRKVWSAPLLFAP